MLYANLVPFRLLLLQYVPFTRLDEELFEPFAEFAGICPLLCRLTGSSILTPFSKRALGAFAECHNETTVLFRILEQGARLCTNAHDNAGTAQKHFHLPGFAAVFCVMCEPATAL